LENIANSKEIEAFERHRRDREILKRHRKGKRSIRADIEPGLRSHLVPDEFSYE
jgi:hypothetical protein